jgi:hypothetical protein
MDLEPDEERAMKIAAQFCKALLVRKSPSGQQCIHIGIALRGLDAFPSSVPDTAIELGIVEECGQWNQVWVLQVYANGITLSLGGTEFSDSYTRFSFHVESTGYHALTGDIAEFESVFDDLDWSEYRLYTRDYSGRD